MDRSSFSIDRHTPIIPSTHWDGLLPRYEHDHNRALRDYIAEIVIKKPSPNAVQLGPHRPKFITTEMLQEAQDAIDKCRLYKSSYLESRGVDVSKHVVCQTSALVDVLPYGTVYQLSLCLSDRYSKIRDIDHIDGLSFPVFQNGLFFGFVTRILNSKVVKYCVSVPNRLTYGISSNKGEIYIVEGIFDAIRLIDAGLNAMAIGDSQPNYYKLLVASRFPRVRLMFDSDYAGYIGCFKAYNILTNIFGVTADRIAIVKPFPDYSDPATCGGSVEMSFSELTALI